MTHTPIRTCRVCRTKNAKQALERWVIRDGELVLDNDIEYGGRGFYSCRSGCSTKIQQVVKSLKKKRGAKKL